MDISETSWTEEKGTSSDSKGLLEENFSDLIRFGTMEQRVWEFLSFIDIIRQSQGRGNGNCNTYVVHST